MHNLNSPIQSNTQINVYCTKVLTLFIFLLLVNATGYSQESTSSVGSISMSAGISYGIAPTLTVGSRETSGTFNSIYGDLVLNEKIIGRAQYSRLNVNSLADGYDLLVNSGWSINGSVGYNITLSSLTKLHIPIMGTFGYANIDRNSGFDHAGAQVGITLAPKYYITDRFVANLSLRVLKGTKVDQGSELGQNDFSIGIMYRFL